MHWFDRLSQQIAAAPEARSSRRGALKGAAVAAVAIPLASDRVAYAGNRMEAFAARNLCVDCFAYEGRKYAKELAECGSLFAVNHSSVTDSKKKKKAPRPPNKMTPPEAAKETACQARARKFVAPAFNNCRTVLCAPTAPLPNNNGTPPSEGGTSTCAPGTTLCGTTMCCFNGDACCPCSSAGGLICCAGVIGCTCC